MLNKNNEKNSFAICYGFCKFELSLTGLYCENRQLSTCQPLTFWCCEMCQLLTCQPSTFSYCEKCHLLTCQSLTYSYRTYSFVWHIDWKNRVHESHRTTYPYSRLESFSTTKDNSWLFHKIRHEITILLPKSTI
jgi:hypothetical protein